jgi:hypothetical protein
MAEQSPTWVSIQLPGELIGRIEELKRDRPGDRDKPVEQIIEEMCRSYIRVRERARQEVAVKDELEQSYRERPHDWDDAAEWASLYPADEDRKP